MNEPRINHSSICHKGYAYAIDGYNAGGSIERLKIKGENSAWEVFIAKNDCMMSLAKQVVTVISNKIVTFGGHELKQIPLMAGQGYRDRIEVLNYGNMIDTNTGESIDILGGLRD